jgi:hypothetical protein
MKILIDTNIPIHHQPLEQINWKEVTGKDDVTLLFSVTIFDELDKHTHNPRLASRARRLRKDIYNFTKSGLVKGSIKAEIIEKPHARVLDELGLDSTQNDQWILAAVINYIKSNPNEDVRLVTADFGMKVRAELLNIPTLILDEKYEIKDEDEEQKENKRLKGELNKLKSATPKLEICFINGNKIAEYEIHSPNFSDYKEAEMRMIKSKYPRVFEDETYSYRLGRNYTKQDGIVYNGQLATYYDEHSRYLDGRKELYFAEILTIEIELVIKNSGLILAKDIDLELNFPETVTVSIYPSNARIPEPQKPLPPHLGVLIRQGFSQGHNHFKPIAIKDGALPIITKIGGESVVEFHLDNLKQQKEVALNKLYVTFGNYEDVTGFSVKYSIRAENVVDVLQANVNVKIQKT